jgi:hypothetical protein
MPIHVSFASALVLALDRCAVLGGRGQQPADQVRRPPAEQLGQRWYEQQAPSRQPAASRPGTL